VTPGGHVRRPRHPLGSRSAGRRRAARWPVPTDSRDHYAGLDGPARPGRMDYKLFLLAAVEFVLPTARIGVPPTGSDLRRRDLGARIGPDRAVHGEAPVAAARSGPDRPTLSVARNEESRDSSETAGCSTADCAQQTASRCGVSRRVGSAAEGGRFAPRVSQVNGHEIARAARVPKCAVSSKHRRRPATGGRCVGRAPRAMGW